MRKDKVYGAFAIVGLVSSIAVWLSRHNELLQVIAAVPLVGSVMAGLFEVLRDQVAHDRELMRQGMHGDTCVIGAYVA